MLYGWGSRQCPHYRDVLHREVLLYRVFIDWPVQGAVERGETHLFIKRFFLARKPACTSMMSLTWPPPKESKCNIHTDCEGTCGHTMMAMPAVVA